MLIYLFTYVMTTLGVFGMEIDMTLLICLVLAE